MFDLGDLANFHFLRPGWLLLVPAIIVATLAVKRFRVVDNVDSQIAPHLLAALTVKAKQRALISPQVVVLLIFILICISLAGPTWHRQDTPLSEDQANLIIALDLSSTMQQSDIQPSRLERAKQKILDLVELRGSARTGIIVFSGSAHQLIPLSNDPDVIHQFVASIKPEIMPASSRSLRTQADKVLPLVEATLSDADIPASIVLISDSMNKESAQKLKKYFSSNSHQLLVLGVGRTALEPSELNLSADHQFDDVHIPLQRKSLRELANDIGGFYQEVSADKQDIRRINGYITRHLALVGDQASPWQDKGYVLLVPIMLLLLLLFRKGWVLQFFCLILIVSFQPNNTVLAQSQVQNSLGSTIKESLLNLWLSDDQMGRYYFERADYERAAQYFADPAWKATSYYYAEKFNAAAELYKQQNTLHAAFNYANALAQGQHYVAAVRAYTKMLERAPDHAGALHNRQIVQDLVDAINDMSANQQSETGARSKQLDGTPQRGDGADQNNIADEEQIGFTAEQLLSDTQIRDMWMRQVQADPARFLAAKFQLQLNRQNDASLGNGQNQGASDE